MGRELRLAGEISFQCPWCPAGLALQSILHNGGFVWDEALLARGTLWDGEHQAPLPGISAGIYGCCGHADPIAKSHLAAAVPGNIAELLKTELHTFGKHPAKFAKWDLGKKTMFPGVTVCDPLEIQSLVCLFVPIENMCPGAISKGALSTRLKVTLEV